MTDSGGYIIGKVSALRQSVRMMATPSKILFLVLFTLSMGEPAEDEIEIMKEMMLEMNEKLARTEEDLNFTKNQLAVGLTDLATALNDLATKDDLATTKTTLMGLELEVTTVREPPFIHACGSHLVLLSIKSQTIPYTTLLYSWCRRTGHRDRSLHSSSPWVIHHHLEYHC